MRSLLPWALVFASLPLVVSARDVYGNATPWTNSDTIIWEMHQKQNAFGSPSSGPSWQSQLAARETQKRLAAEDALRAKREARELQQWTANRQPEVPLTWAQEMERYVLWKGDAAAADQEKLAFYYVETGNLSKARRHLEMVVFRKGRRAGEAAWQLYQLHKAEGPEPDAAQAEQYLTKSTALGYSEGFWQIASARYFGDSARNVPADPVGALPLLEKIFAGTDRVNGPKAARLLLAYDSETPGREAHALAVLRQLTTNGNAGPHDSTRLAQLLISSPGGWKENHPEILTALRVSYVDSDSYDLLARVYLGLEPAALPYVKPDYTAADGPLHSLARFALPSTDALLAQIIQRGPDQRLPQAEKFLAALVGMHPDSSTYTERYAEFLSGNYGGTPNLPAALRLYEKLASDPKASPTVVVAAGRLLATELPGKPADHAGAFPLFERAAKAGEPYAQYRYAQALLEGKGCTANPAAALEYLMANTRSDHPEPPAYPLYALAARALRESAPHNRDVMSQAQGRASAPRSFAPAQLEYAHDIYTLSKLEQADRMREDYPQFAVELATLAANTGLDEARLLLARFHREGFGTAVDVDVAVQIYESGTNANVPAAIAALADIQLDVSTRYHNLASGFALAERAAAANDPRGLYLLGRCYLRGEGTPANSDRAMDLLKRSANAGDVEALTLLASQRLTDPEKSRENYAQSVEELRQAAAAGSIEAAIQLIQALGADPARSPEQHKKLNQLLLSYTWIEVEDETLNRDRETVAVAVNQLALLTSQRRDPALSYETGRWLLGESSSLAQPCGLTFYSEDLFLEAAQQGHHGAEYRLALKEIAVGRDFLTKPEEDAAALKNYDAKYSTGHLSEGLRYMRAAADGGQPEAIAYLKSKGIEIVSSVSGKETDQAALEKIDPAARGERRDAEYTLALRAMRIANEYLAKPEEDSRVVATVGQKYSDAYFEEALQYFRSSAAAGLPASIAYLEARGIAIEAPDTGNEPDRASAAKLNPSRRPSRL